MVKNYYYSYYYQLNCDVRALLWAHRLLRAWSLLKLSSTKLLSLLVSLVSMALCVIILWLLMSVLVL